MTFVKVSHFGGIIDETIGPRFPGVFAGNVETVLIRLQYWEISREIRGGLFYGGEPTADACGSENPHLRKSLYSCF